MTFPEKIIDFVAAAEKNHRNHAKMEDDEDHAGEVDGDLDDQTLQRKNNQKTLIFIMENRFEKIDTILSV